jgi:hypothetical protein
MLQHQQLNKIRSKPTIEINQKQENLQSSTQMDVVRLKVFKGLESQYFERGDLCKSHEAIC